MSTLIAQLPQDVQLYLSSNRKVLMQMRQGRVPEAAKPELKQLLAEMLADAVKQMRAFVAPMDETARQAFLKELEPELEAYVQGDLGWFEKLPSPMQHYLSLLRAAYAQAKPGDDVRAGEKGKAILEAQAEAEKSWDTMMSGLTLEERQGVEVEFHTLTLAFLEGRINPVRSPSPDSIQFGVLSSLLN
jgi:hypothetical protein